MWSWLKAKPAWSQKSGKTSYLTPCQNSKSNQIKYIYSGENNLLYLKKFIIQEMNFDYCWVLRRRTDVAENYRILPSEGQHFIFWCAFIDATAGMLPANRNHKLPFSKGDKPFRGSHMDRGHLWYSLLNTLGKKQRPHI